MGITEAAFKMEQRPREKADYQDELNQIFSDHRAITLPFKLPPLRQSAALESSGLMNNNGSGFRPNAGDSIIFGY